MKNNIGDIISGMKILEFSHYNKSGNIKYYICECIKCGTKSIKSINNLRKYENTRCKGCRQIKINNRVGEVYGKLTITSFSRFKGEGSSQKIYYNCRCECNNEIEVRYDHLQSGTESCGCKQLDYVTKHSLSGTRLYYIYRNMIQRCYNTNDKYYNLYGSKGIYVCNEWLESEDRGLINFYNWSMDNGYSDELTIDRIDNNGPYAPWNCRWATHEKQANNRSNNRIISVYGTNYTIAELSRLYNISYHILFYNLNEGKSIYNILESNNKIVLQNPIRFYNNPIKFI